MLNSNERMQFINEYMAVFVLSNDRVDNIKEYTGTNQNGKKLIIFVDSLEFIADCPKTKLELLQHLYEIDELLRV